MPALELGADLRYVSARYADTANTLRDDAYTLVGASASYKLNRTTRLVLRGKTLTDKIYADSFSGSTMAYLGQPRTIDLSIQSSF